MHKIFIALFLLAASSTSSAGSYARAAQAIEEFIDGFRKSDVEEIADEISPASKSGSHIAGIRSKTKCCIIIFKNTHEIGRLGDWLTAKRMSAMGYIKMVSHIGVQGIDGVYVKKYQNGEVYDIVIIENKVNSGKPFPDQMSDGWVKKNAEKLLKSSKKEEQETGAMLLDALENNLGIIKKEVWHHDLGKGVTKIYSVTEDGTISEAKHIFKDPFLDSQIRQRCKSGSLECVEIDS